MKRTRDHVKAPAAAGDEADDVDLATSLRILLFVLLLLVVVAILAVAIMFSDNSRVFLLKFAAAALLSITPGWIYLQFLRNKGHSLYDEYVLNLFRLKIDETANLPAPPQHTSWYPQWRRAHSNAIPPGVTDNLYRRKFESVYGPSAVSTTALFATGRGSLRERAETFAPVVMATIVLALGWTLVLHLELLRNIDLLGDLELSGRPDLPADPLRFGFLGAYAFIVLDLVRRYFREDLKSAAYLSATIRVVFASLLVVVMSEAGFANLVSENQANFAAFFVGFFPRAGFTWIRGLLPTKLQRAIPQLESDYPLRHLEGLTIWYETRLIEEGIESVQNLCSANLVDLMLKTRVPIVRLIDWLDQAFLYLHLPKDPAEPENAPPALRHLRGLGIRTATQLERAWNEGGRDGAHEHLRALLGRALLPEAPDSVDAVVGSILLGLQGEPNYWHVREFRKLLWLKEEGEEAAPGPPPAPSVTLPAGAQPGTVPSQRPAPAGR